MMHQQVFQLDLPQIKPFRPSAITGRPTFAMKRLPTISRSVEQIIKPEIKLERLLLQTPEFLEGMVWGEPRFGHPEGKVCLHVREVLDNIDFLPNLDAALRQRLRLVAIAHDAFKFCEDRSHPRDWSKHHGAIARRFMERFTDDQAVLDVIECHDDAYYAWRNTRPVALGPDYQHKTLENLLHRVGHCIQLYYLFFKCDTQTGDKTQAPLKWFEKNVLV